MRGNVRWLMPFIVVVAALLGACSKSDSGTASAAAATSLNSLQASGAEAGKMGKLRISFTGPLADDTVVTLLSSAPAVLTVAPTVTVPKGALASDVPFQGVVLGSAFITATAADVSRTTSATVVDHFALYPNDQSTALEVGATTVVSFSLNAATPDPVTIPLMAADATIATAPATVTVSPFTSTGYATIAALAVGATPLTATFGGKTSHEVVTVVDHARISSVNVPNLAETGAVFSMSISLDAIVAKPTSIVVNSTDSTVAGPPAALVIPEGSNFANAQLTALAAGQTSLGFVLADSTVNRPLTVLDTPQLEGVNASSQLFPGNATQLSVNLDVVAAKPHDVTLTSSDPTVLTVPATIKVQPGQSSGSTSVTPLKEGDAVVTATFNGISRQLAAHVGTSALTINLYGSSALSVGALGSVQIQVTGGVSNVARLVALTSSDPSIVAVPPTLVVSNYGSVSFSALKAGTTSLMATTGGVSQSLLINVVAHPAIQSFGPTFNLAVGQSSSTYLGLSATPAAGAMLTFTSSAPTVVAAPAPIALASNTYAQPQFTGLTSGTAVITATLGTATASAIFYVGGSASSFAYLTGFSVGASTMQVGAAAYGYANMSAPPVADAPLVVDYSVPGIVSITPSPSILAGASQVYFPVQALAAGTTDIKVTYQGVTLTQSVTVVATPTYTINVPATVKVGTTIAGSLSANTLLAANTTFALASADTTLATVSDSTLTLGPGQQNPQVIFGVRGVAVGTVNVTATLGATVLTASVMVTP